MSKNKRVFSRVLKGQLNSGDIERVALADALVDEALDNLEFEEPTLRKWLEEDEELGSVYRATLSTMYSLVLKDLMREVPLYQAFDKTHRVMFRTIAAVAHSAAMRERESMNV